MAKREKSRAHIMTACARHAQLMMAIITIVLLTLLITPGTLADMPIYPIVANVFCNGNIVIMESRLMTQESINGDIAYISGCIYIRNYEDKTIRLKKCDMQILQDSKTVLDDDDYFCMLIPGTLPAGADGIIEIKQTIKTDHAENFQVIAILEFEEAANDLWVKHSSKQVRFEKDPSGSWVCNIKTDNYPQGRYNGMLVWARNNRIAWAQDIYFEPGKPEKLIEVLWNDERKALASVGVEPNECFLLLYRGVTVIPDGWNKDPSAP